jgi:hypothetical protein
VCGGQNSINFRVGHHLREKEARQELTTYPIPNPVCTAINLLLSDTFFYRKYLLSPLYSLHESKDCSVRTECKAWWTFNKLRLGSIIDKPLTETFQGESQFYILRAIVQWRALCVCLNVIHANVLLTVYSEAESMKSFDYDICA